MTSREWRDHFRRNKHDRMTIPWDEPTIPPARGRAGLLRSLACFQLGESSDGRHLRRLAWTAGDELYAEAIELFIAEEQEHARVLGLLLDRFAAPRLHRQWSHSLFRRCRRLLGFRAEIVVLLMAELAGWTYYDAVRDGFQDTAVKRVCDQLLHDENFHIRFHCEYLHQWIVGRSSLTRFLAWWVLGWLFAGAASVVAWDHRGAIATLGLSPKQFFKEAWRGFVAARTCIFTGATFSRSGAPAPEWETPGVDYSFSRSRPATRSAS